MALRTKEELEDKIKELEADRRKFTENRGSHMENPARNRYT